MSQPSYLFAFVNSAKLIGLTTTGILAGYTFATTQNALPVLLASRNAATPERTVVEWNDMFVRGGKVVVPLILVASASLFFAAYNHPYLPLPISPFLNTPTRSLDVGMQLALAGFLVLTAAPYTALVMMSNIKSLRSTSKKVEGREVSVLSHSEKETILPRIQKWSKQHNFRPIVFTLALVVGLTAL